MNLEQQTPKEIKVFISYSHDSADHKQLVLEFANELREWGIDAIIDQYYESSPPSEGWQKWMDRQIAESNFVIVVCSEIYYRRVSGEEEEGKGRGVKWESTLLYLHIYNSDSLNKRFIPVLLPGGTEKHIPIPLQSTTHYRYPESFENLYRQLTQQPSVEKPEIGQLRVLPPLNIKATSVDAQILSNPYRGLEAFREQDAKNFFGRDVESKDLVELVEKRHFVAVLGSSGSGKSSLVFAGLIPQLRQNSQWLIATCRPQNAPLREISVTLIDALYQTELNEINRISEIKALTSGLEQQTLELTDIIARIFDKHPTTRLLLVIDQFEELYTLSPTTTQSLFLNHLLNFLEQHTTPPKTTVLITLRADFLGYALSHPKLAKLLDTYRNKMLGDLSDADLSLAIEQPARALNVTFEEGLAERIVRDVGEQAGSLPLLQFALQQLWERRDQNRLTHAGYEVLGTVTQALARHADQVYERFSETGKALFRQLFVQMVRPGEGTEDTRQVMMLPADPARHEIIRQLANERLVVTRHDANTGENTVEIAHEALIRHWQRLKAWMKEDRSFRVWQENLRGYMRDQVLLRDAQLAVAQEWVVQRDSELTEAERSFIQASVAQREAELAEKRRNQRRWTVFVMIFFMVALGLSGLAWLKSQEAEQNLFAAKENAEQAKKYEAESQVNLVHSEENLTHSIRNQSLMLSGLAEIQLKEDKPATAMRLALEALPNVSETHPNRPFVAQAYDMLSRGMNYQYQGIFQHEEGVSKAVVSPNGKYLLTASGKLAYVWRLETGQFVLTLQGHKDVVRSVAYHPDSIRILTASDDNTARVWDGLTGQTLLTLQAHKYPIFSADYSHDGTRIVTAEGNYTACVWNADSGKALLTLQGHKGSIFSVDYSHDSTRIVTASGDKTARTWDAYNGQALLTLQGHKAWVWSATYSPDSTQILTTSGFGSDSKDNTARVWNADSGQVLLTLQGHKDTVWSAAYSLDGSRIITASSDKTARVWDAHSGQALLTLQHEGGAVRSATYSSDGKHIVTASDDETARMWNPYNGQYLLTLQHESTVWSAAYSPDGTQIVTTSGSIFRSDNTARLWDVHSGRVLLTLRGHEYPVISAEYSPNGARIVTASSDKTARIWDAHSGQLLLTLQHENEVHSATYSYDGTRIITASYKDTRIWDAHSGQLLFTLQHEVNVYSATYSPDGTRIVTASSDKTAKIWDAHSGQLLLTLQHEDDVNSATYSPDGTRIVAASYYGKTAKIWDAHSGQLLLTLQHENGVNSATYSHDGTRIVTASSDKTAKIWDAHSGQLLAILTGHQDSVISAEFSPDGKQIITASYDNTVRIWLTFPTLEEMIDYAKKMLPPRDSEDKRDAGIENFRLTCAEREQFFLEEIERCKITKN